MKYEVGDKVIILVSGCSGCCRGQIAEVVGTGYYMGEPLYTLYRPDWNGHDGFINNVPYKYNPHCWNFREHEIKSTAYSELGSFLKEIGK